MSLEPPPHPETYYSNLASCKLITNLNVSFKVSEQRCILSIQTWTLITPRQSSWMIETVKHWLYWSCFNISQGIPSHFCNSFQQPETTNKVTIWHHLKVFPKTLSYTKDTDGRQQMDAPSKAEEHEQAYWRPSQSYGWMGPGRNSS